jgi:hypothetical protein
MSHPSEPDDDLSAALQRLPRSDFPVDVEPTPGQVLGFQLAGGEEILSPRVARNDAGSAISAFDSAEARRDVPCLAGRQRPKSFTELVLLRMRYFPPGWYRAVRFAVRSASCCRIRESTALPC